MSGSAADANGKVRGAERRTRVVHARFSAMEMARIEQAAQAAALTVSAFMRSLTVEGAGVRPFLTEADRLVLGALLVDLRAVGVNLDQLVRAANRSGPRPDAQKAVIEDVQRVMAALLYELGLFAGRRASVRKGGA